MIPVLTGDGHIHSNWNMSFKSHASSIYWAIQNSRGCDSSRVGEMGEGDGGAENTGKYIKGPQGHP